MSKKKTAHTHTRNKTWNMSTTEEKRGKIDNYCALCSLPDDASWQTEKPSLQPASSYMLHEYICMCLFLVSCFIGFLQCQPQIVKVKMLYLPILMASSCVLLAHINCYRLRSVLLFLILFAHPQEENCHTSFFIRTQPNHLHIERQWQSKEKLQWMITAIVYIWYTCMRSFFIDATPHILHWFNLWGESNWNLFGWTFEIL